MPSSPDGTADIWAFLQSGDRNRNASPAKVRPGPRRRGAPLHVGSQSGPARDTIISLIVVAAALLDSELRGGTFTLEQLVKKMCELLGRDRALDVVDEIGR